MSTESALINAANGDFVATLTAVLALFIMGTFAYFIRWVMQTIPDQMQKDRESITKQMANDREAVCAKLGELIVEMRDTKCDTKEWLEGHDDQAKEILATDRRIETKLDARPCLIGK